MFSSKKLFIGKPYLLASNHHSEIVTANPVVFGFNETKINTNYINLTFILNHLLGFWSPSRNIIVYQLTIQLRKIIGII
jgi:hypothetical protein